MTEDITGGVTFNPFTPVTEQAAAVVELNGHTLTVDGKGLHNWNSNWSYIKGDGALTSNQRFIDIVNHVNTGAEVGLTQPLPQGWNNYGLIIEAAITDSTHAVGLRISGKRPNARAAVVYLRGRQSNTFTGDVEISSGSNYLAMGKEGGATAVQGNIRASDWATVRFDESQQVSRSTTITLRRATLYFGVTRKELSTHFRQLKIEGRGLVKFSEKSHTHKRFLYLDELAIDARGFLEVSEWKHGRDYFLVSKTMNKRALEALLGKIIFIGRDPKSTHLRDYNSQFWEISGLPEPATYGAILGAVGLGLTLWRRRRKRNH